jgi:hypothetical protein
LTSPEPARTRLPAARTGRAPARPRGQRQRRDRPRAETQAGVAEVRIIADEATLAAVQALLADRLGQQWHPTSRLPSRYDDARFRQNGILIVIQPPAAT